MKRLFVLCLLLAGAGRAAGQGQAGEPIKLTVQPAAAPVPALRYELLPGEEVRTPGNAALLYYRSFSPEWQRWWRREHGAAKLDEALHAPLASLPADMAWIKNVAFLREVDRGARREYCDFELTPRVKSDGIGLLLPDIQGFRETAQLLALRTRYELAARDFDKAVYTLQTSFRLAHDVGGTPFLIGSLVGVAVGQVATVRVDEFIATPGSPNLYWALTALPNPFIQLRKALEGERLFLEAELPGLKDVDAGPWSSEQEQVWVDRVMRLVHALDNPANATAARNRLELVVLVSVAYPRARQAMLARGRKPAEVDAMPALQVVLSHSYHLYVELRDEMTKWYGVPYWQAVGPLEAVEQRMKEVHQRNEGLPLTELLPATSKVYRAAARLDRRIAALRCVEAVRLYVAAHGALPATLDAVSAVPIPIDPILGKPFEYRVSGNTFTLSGAAPKGGPPSDSLTYEVTVAH